MICPFYTTWDETVVVSHEQSLKLASILLDCTQLYLQTLFHDMRIIEGTSNHGSIYIQVFAISFVVLVFKVPIMTS